MVRPPLALALLRASRWFDSQLLEKLEHRGWPSLSPAQSLVFAHLSEDGTPPSELARRLGTSRQAAHQLVAGLCRLGLVEVAENPGRRRGRLVLLTASGRALANDAREVLAALEEPLGRARVEALHELLDGLAGPDAAGNGVAVSEHGDETCHLPRGERSVSTPLAVLKTVTGERTRGTRCW